MKGRGLLRLFLLFGFVSCLTKFVKGRSNLLHDGVIDSLGYDPNVLSLLQMEQSLDLDDDEAAYLGASLLEKGPSLLQHSSTHLGPSYSTDNWDEDSFLEEGEEDDEGDDEESLLESGSSSTSHSYDKDWDQWESPNYLESESSSTSDSVDKDWKSWTAPNYLETKSSSTSADKDWKSWSKPSYLQTKSSSTSHSADKNWEDWQSPNYLESESTSASDSADKDWESWSSPSYLETGSSYDKTLYPKSFSSMIQLHNFELDPLNFLQDDSVLLLNDDEQNSDFELEPERRSNLKAYVLRTDPYEKQAAESNNSLDLTNGQQLLSVLKAYKFWLVFLVVLLVIALVVRLYYLDKFLKFRTELWNRFDALNQVLVAKFNGVFNKSKASTESGDTSPLLSA